MSCLTEKTIGELLNYKFFIPSYQRGYRWTDRQVEDLLEDIWEFITKAGKKENEWYCLQPVVVKAGTISSEVLDGQQRLTTIFLILKHLEKFVESERKNFEIEYQTRNTEKINSKDFLINIDIKNEKDAGENIDYFHIYGAYKKIESWFKQKANEGYISISSKFITPFLESTKVIWYEVSVEEDSVEIFTRLNMGKIPLTNAELIKALFLNSSNFTNSDPENIRLKQLEIASEWDRIEYALQNEEMWWFINKDENILSTRIEFIFDLMFSTAKLNDEEIQLRKHLKLDNQQLKERQNSHPTIGEKFGSDSHSTFRFFSDKFKDHKISNDATSIIERNWEEIKRSFMIIEEWFANRELYHKIGFLITTGTDIKTLIIAVKDKQKGEFRKELDQLISERIKCIDIAELEYGADSWSIKKILLLHNIRTMLNNKNESSRFPFDRYKKEKWDIEHVHAIATEMPKIKQHRIDWLNNSLEFITDIDLQSKISNFIENYDADIKGDATRFDILSNMVLINYAKKGNNGKNHEDINDISNLVLLDSGTNRGYKNAIFPAKRKSIIEKEMTGTFIPICTKNVFLKYYRHDVSQMTFWDENDRKLYFENIKATIFPSQTIK